MRSLKVTIVMLVLSQAFDGDHAHAQMLKNARQERQESLASVGRASLEHVPLTRFGRSLKSQWDARLMRTAERRGVSPEILRGKRMKTLEAVGGALGGMGAGLSMSAASVTPQAAPTPSLLRSNLSSRMSWQSFNRNYSSLPYHRAANGY